MGLAIQQSGVAREDIFVTTKIPCKAHTFIIILFGDSKLILVIRVTVAEFM